jgi:hypothetical protein
MMTPLKNMHPILKTYTIEIEAHDEKSDPSTGTRSFKNAFAGMRKTNQKEKEDKEVETKAFDLSIISFGNGKQKSKANERSIKPEEKDNFEQTRFDFGKITFAREHGTLSPNLRQRYPRKMLL